MMFPPGMRKVGLGIFIVFIIVTWKLLHYFSDTNPQQFLNEIDRNAESLGIETRKRVLVSVYYETLCSDSRNFILKQLVPTYEKLHDLMELEFIPYGKATTVEEDGTYIFKCQHSYIECEGNKVHACALNQKLPKDVYLKYVACMIEDNMEPHIVGQRCADEYDIDYNPIRECANGLEGSRLLKEYGDQTHAVSPKITFIPTIQFNHTDKVPLVRILKDLFNEICKIYENNLPSECL